MPTLQMEVLQVDLDLSGDPEPVQREK